MSSPVGRSLDPSEISPYAPKWARELAAASGVNLRLDMVGNEDIAAAADRVDLAAESFRHRRSLEPTVMPEPPMPESWQRSRARSLSRSNGTVRMLLRFLSVGFLAALFALAIVLILPTSESYLAKQQAANGSDAPRRDDAARHAARSAAATSKHTRTVSVARADLPRPRADEQRLAIPERFASARAGMMSPAMAAAAPAARIPGSAEFETCERGGGTCFTCPDPTTRR